MAFKSALLVERCSLATGTGNGCAWCGKPRPKSRRRWCSEHCGTAFWNNHWWSLARRSAKRRDKYRCVRCGHVLPKRPARPSFGTHGAYLAAMRAWRAMRRDDRLEVNHRDPCHGQHGAISCAHHLDNLETLCVGCHRRHTASLRSAVIPKA